MADPYLQELFAQRIGGAQYGKGTAVYKFEQIKRAKRAALAANPGKELIDMGVGEPDEPAPRACIDALYEAAKDPANRGYADNGGDRFRNAAAKWMKDVVGVELDAQRHLCHSIGSKAALSILPACFINPGDVALMTTPGYPVFGTHARYYGGEVYNLPLRRENAFLPDLREIPPEVLRRAKTLVINYPNNPTGASATTEFFHDVVAFARRHRLVVIHDAAYAALVFEGRPTSILSVPGAMDCCLELHSMSKTFNMTGWRLGFVAGNELLVRAYADVKDNTDSGQFLAIQAACAHALEHPEYTRAIAAKYSRRMDKLVRVLRKHGFDAEKPRGSFFLYVPAPRQAVRRGDVTAFETAQAFSNWLITDRLISTVPWDDVGRFVRFSVTFTAPGEAEEDRVVGEIDRRLGEVEFVF